jgi:flagellar biosynthesis chaperone FliJ
MSSEEIVQQLIKFVSETGRLPKPDEPGLENLVNSAIRHFGSLENALKIAGLLTPNDKTARTTRIRQTSLMHIQASKTSTWSAYPKDYFLNLLGLERKSHYPSPAPNGTPTWWERRANMQYVCSTCRRPIQKGEKYIGRKKLRPGMRGIYGHRGTYFTDYYHIVCLLRRAENEIEEGISHANSEISSIEKEISDYTKEISLKRQQIETCRIIILKVIGDYEQAGFWKKIGKWFGTHYTSWSKTRQISRLEREIAHIENKEIPERETHISQLKRRINDLEHQLNEIDTRIQELMSR